MILAKEDASQSLKSYLLNKLKIYNRKVNKNP